jgi:hypothetical protein
MATMSRAFQVRSLTVLLALAACACGGDDNNKVAADDDNEAGAPAVAPSYPPALSPDDCATSTSKIKLTQPDGAAVWGGLVLLDFTVEGAKVDSFDVQVLDPSLGAWTGDYVNTQERAQHDDGSYLLAVSPYFSDVNKDKELKLRVRPTQQGCPEADWTETSTFSAGDPLTGTKWKAEIPSTGFSGQLNLQRQAIPNDMALPSSRLTLGPVTLELDFGKKGVLTEVVTLPLSSKKGEPYDGCTVSLTFTGSYEVGVRPQYGGVTIAFSEQTLTSTEGTTCDSPSIDDMAISAEDFDMPLNAYTQQGVNINYLPLAYVEPGVPTWQNNQFGQLFQQLSQFLGYATTKEVGNVDGYLYPQDVTLERQ